MIVAVDGPSASGKSTVARAVAGALGLPYLDTGSMYRAVTWAVVEAGVDPQNAGACAAVASRVELDILGPGRIAVAGRDVSGPIRGEVVTAAVSTVAAHPAVRAVLVERQRGFVGAEGAVVEGRDIGTVVFPAADVKVFLTADPDERARRRDAEAGRGAGHDIARRDHVDASRPVSPLAIADDAVVIDATGRDADDVVAEVLRLAARRDAAGPAASGAS